MVAVTTAFGMSRGADTWKMGSRHADLRSGDHSGRPTEKGGQPAPNFVQEAAWWVLKSVMGEWGCLEFVY